MSKCKECELPKEKERARDYNYIFGLATIVAAIKGMEGVLAWGVPEGQEWETWMLFISFFLLRLKMYHNDISTEFDDKFPHLILAIASWVCFIFCALTLSPSDIHQDSIAISNKLTTWWFLIAMIISTLWCIIASINFSGQKKKQYKTFLCFNVAYITLLFLLVLDQPSFQINLMLLGCFIFFILCDSVISGQPAERPSKVDSSAP